MPKDNIERAIKNAMGKDQSDYKSMTYEGYCLLYTSMRCTRRTRCTRGSVLPRLLCGAGAHVAQFGQVEGGEMCIRDRYYPRFIISYSLFLKRGLK